MTDQNPKPPKEPRQIKIKIVLKPSPAAIVLPTTLYFFAWVLLIGWMEIGFPQQMLMYLYPGFLLGLLAVFALVHFVWIRMVKSGKTRRLPTNKLYRQSALVVTTIAVASMLFGLEPVLRQAIANTPNELAPYFAQNVSEEDRTQLTDKIATVLNKTIDRAFAVDQEMTQYEAELFQKRIEGFSAAVTDEVLDSQEVQDLIKLYSFESTGNETSPDSD